MAGGAAVAKGEPKQKDEAKVKEDKAPKAAKEKAGKAQTKSEPAAPVAVPAVVATPVAAAAPAPVAAPPKPAQAIPLAKLPPDVSFARAPTVAYEATVHSAVSAPPLISLAAAFALKVPSISVLRLSRFWLQLH